MTSAGGEHHHRLIGGQGEYPERQERRRYGMCFVDVVMVRNVDIGGGRARVPRGDCCKFSTCNLVGVDQVPVNGFLHELSNGEGE